MGGVRQHVQPGLVRMGAAVLVDGFGYAEQQFAGMGKDFRSSDVWMEAEGGPLGEVLAGWVGDEFLHGGSLIS